MHEQGPGGGLQRPAALEERGDGVEQDAAGLGQRPVDVARSAARGPRRRRTAPARAAGRAASTGRGAPARPATARRPASAAARRRAAAPGRRRSARSPPARRRTRRAAAGAPPSGRRRRRARRPAGRRGTPASTSSPARRAARWTASSDLLAGRPSGPCRRRRRPASSAPSRARLARDSSVSSASPRSSDVDDQRLEPGVPGAALLGGPRVDLRGGEGDLAAVAQHGLAQLRPSSPGAAKLSTCASTTSIVTRTSSTVCCRRDRAGQLAGRGAEDLAGQPRGVAAG